MWKQSASVQSILASPKPIWLTCCIVTHQLSQERGPRHRKHDLHAKPRTKETRLTCRAEFTKHYVLSQQNIDHEILCVRKQNNTLYAIATVSLTSCNSEYQLSTQREQRRNQYARGEQRLKQESRRTYTQFILSATRNRTAKCNKSLYLQKNQFDSLVAL
jgi:hypothetical protein